jgi:hypothetical protein|tara:strand:- start:157 stop:318 length:162 start_codon:yes stop_codon:yes gene_type:complete
MHDKDDDQEGARHFYALAVEVDPTYQCAHDNLKMIDDLIYLEDTRDEEFFSTQ